MANRLADAISPYLRSHADNPVDWFPWGAEAFAEAERRDVPVLISIGYATCHWCHVMARESFSDPVLAAELNARFVAVKVDREEHPDVDAGYLSAASAFTGNLGWPLTVFTTPRGRAFYAGTYFPPLPLAGRASFRQVLDAVWDAWENRRARGGRERGCRRRRARCRLGGRHRGCRSAGRARAGRRGGVARRGRGRRVRRFRHGAEVPRRAGARLSARRARRASASPPRRSNGWRPLRCTTRVDGGFFRYATRRDWGDPHYERMLYDNALLLRDYATAWQLTAGGVGASAPRTASPASCSNVLRRPAGGFASAQDSESTIDGARVEGTYYRSSAQERANARARRRSTERC